jgi:hypothetical protein
MSETALLRAVRNQIRLAAGFSGANTHRVRIELDENVPAITGDYYALVTPGPITAGPSQETNEGAEDLLYSFNVSVIMRAQKKPRDRRRELFLDLTAGMQIYTNLIKSYVDFQENILTLANALIVTEETSTEGFIEMPKLAEMGPIRQAPAEIYGASNEPQAGIIRTMHFRGARRIKTRTQVSS